MAFNKSKVLEAAQKYLNQGKIPQAIAEYQQILRVEPNDQVTLMTIGDLFVRTQDTKQALEYFEKLAKLFLSDGFISKGIAIYKKIAKLAPEETHPLERLAELYVQQGVMSEARPIYLQLAEAHLKSNRSQQAVETLQKLIDLEPDNLRIQLHLAELYQNIGQPQEASRAYLRSAHRMLDRGDFAEALKMADRSLKADGKNRGAMLLKARALGGQGQLDQAIALLEALPDVSAASDAVPLLADYYLQSGKHDRALDLARKAFERGPENAGLVYNVAVALLDSGQAETGLGLLDDIRETMMQAGDFERLARALGTAADRLSGRLEPLEWIVDLYRRSNDTIRLPDALDQLGEAAATAGDLERARAAFEELVQLEPEDENNRRRLNQVLTRLGLPAVEGPEGPLRVEVPAEAPAPFEMEMETVEAAPVVAEAGLDSDTERFVTQALTDVDLFSSYGLTQKAIDLLEGVLRRAPRHTATLEKLLDLYLGAGNDRRTAELAAQLEQIYTDQGDAANADRFAELRRRFTRSAGLAPEEVAAAAQAVAPPPAEFVIPTVEAEAAPMMEVEPTPVEAAPVGAADVHEVDLSAEWDALAAPAEPAPAEPPPAEEIPVVEAPAEYELELAPAASAPEAPAKEAVMTTDQFLSDLAGEIEELELGAPAPPPAAAPAPPPVAAKAEAAGPTDQLHEVFEEFRAELGEMAGEEAEDPETHYNLGIAYREMGLLEEAIGEFQKVAKTIQSGRAFPYVMQCLTLLGLSFQDKGEPKIAAMWYERALKTPGLDQESLMALRYDLGAAYEAAGEPKAALDCFTQVYAMNIDYRDVAERISALQRKS
jgi:tetratricopeptide (TPR) repeat protein